MNLTENEKKLIEAKRAGGNVEVAFHFVETDEEAQELLDRFKSTNSVADYKVASDDTKFYSTSQVESDYELTIFLK